MGEPAHHLATLEALRRRADQDVLTDPVRLARYLDGDYVVRPHVRYIAQQLAALAAGDTKRLMVQVPPQTGKSSLCAVWFPFWWLIKNPRSRVVIGSYAQQLAATRGKAIRRLVNGQGHRWGMQVAHASGQVAEWELETGGGIKSVGVGAGVTGFPADLGIIDDPHKNRAEADSLTYRDHVWDWYSADFLTRLSPGSPMLVIATPWHNDDLMHRLIEQDGTEDEGGLWRVVKLHAFAGVDDPLGRAPGDPLPHPKIPIQDVEASREHWEGRRRASTVRDWNSLYQLDPQPAEGALVDTSLLRARTHQPPPTTPVKSAVAVDPSGGGRDVAGVIGGFLGADQRLYVTDDASLVGPSEQWARAACQLAADIDADLVVVEHNYGGDMARMVVRSAWATLTRENPEDEKFRRLAPQVKLVHAKKGKLLRAEPVAQQISDDRMRFGSYLPEVFHEWSTWQSTDTDSPGRIDASVYLAYELLPVPGAEAVVSTPTGVKRAQMGGARSGARIRRGGPGRR